MTGFCWSGRTTWMYAVQNPAVKVAVAWYGPLARSDHPGDKTALEVAGRIKAASNENQEVVVYPEAPHAFHADFRPSCCQAAAEDG